MKKKLAIRVLTILCTLILCAPVMMSVVNAATVGDGQEPSVFVLAFVKGEDVIGTSAFYMEDTLGDGSTYLVSDAVTAAFVEDGYACVLMGLNYAQEVNYITTSGNLAFYKAPGLEGMKPLKTTADLTSKVRVAYANIGEKGVTGVDYYNLDISDWTEVPGAIYEPGSELSAVILLGAPIMDCNGKYVLGCYSVTNNMEYAISLMDGVTFPSEAVIVKGNMTTQEPATEPQQAAATEPQQPAATQPQQPAATQLPATEPQQPAATQPPVAQPQQQEPQETENTVDTETVVLIVFVVGVGAWFTVKNGKKKTKKAVVQEAAKPVQEGTIMLDSDDMKPIQPAMDIPQDMPPIGMPAPSWQVRGLVGPLEGKVFALDPRGIRTMKFGRDPSCDVAFSPNTPGISAMHCELVQERGEVALRDLQSSYGTYMGQSHVRLEPNVNYHLCEGDEFMLAEGGQVFRLERWGNNIQNYTPAVRSVIDGSVYRADREGRMAFGRDPRNQVVFDANDSSVSSTHCVLYREGGKLYLVDKDSTNGTYFDEKQRLRPNTPYEVRKGMSFFLTTPKYTFVITED